MTFSRVIPFKIAVLFALSGVLQACSRPVEIQRVKLLMGTKVEIIAEGKDQESLEKAVNLGFNEIERLEAKLSRFREDSVISKINRSAGVSPVQVDAEVFALIEKAVAVCGDSNGAFDPTILPMMSLWKFTEKDAVVPSDEEIKQRLSLVDCRKIILKKDESLVFLPEPGMGIDLGGIAKGYAADRAAEALRKSGVRSGLVNAGGNLTVFGGKGRGTAIGVQDPRRRDQILAKIYLKDSAVSTSGDYERFFIFRGIRYSHIIDPKNGYPAQGEESVTVISQDGTLADAWSTALFVLGSDEGLKMLKSHPEMQAMFIDASGKRSMTPGLSERMIWLEGGN
jgi:thiamine biosynthesis lipoprotein